MAVCLRSAILPIPLTACQRGLPQLLIVTKKLLNDCAVKYDFTDVALLDGEERAAILEDVKKWNPRCSFPKRTLHVLPYPKA